MTDLPQEDALLSLTDEEGEDITFRQLCRLTVHGNTYVVLQDPEEEDSVMIFSVTTDSDGEETLEPVYDEAESEEIFYLFQAEDEDFTFVDAE